MKKATRWMTTECMMRRAMSMCKDMMCSGMAVFDARFSTDSSLLYEKRERQTY